MIEEACVEGVAGEHVSGGGDVDAAAGPGIAAVCSHREVLAWVDEAWVGEEGVYYGAEHWSC